MQEISPHIYIETEFPGVTLAVLRCQRGLILIDAPLRIDDTRGWKSMLTGMTGGYERLLVAMDEHFDRTLGIRQMECMTIGHEALSLALKDRPMSFKTQGQESGAEWELITGLGIVRWAVPDITFSASINLYWDNFPIHLFAVPGPSLGSTWLELPQQKTLFVGDTVIPGAPPFLAAADLPAWQEALEILLSPSYKGYTLVSGRAGVISIADVKEQSKFLGKVQQQIEKLADKENIPHEVEHICLQLLKHFDSKPPKYDHYYSRLTYGLTQYIKRHIPASIPRHEK